jgi:hypothetical protein
MGTDTACCRSGRWSAVRHGAQCPPFLSSHPGLVPSMILHNLHYQG